MECSNGEKGFTLMEVLISLGIFAAVLVLSVYILTSAHQLSAQSRERLLALSAARSTVEAIKNTPLANLGTINTDRFVPQELRNGRIILNFNPTNLATANLVTVTVSVRWWSYKNTTAQPDRRLDITTMRSQF